MTGTEYTLPVASATTFGGIKPGEGLTTAADGTTRIADNVNLPGTPLAPNTLLVKDFPTALLTAKMLASGLPAITHPVNSTLYVFGDTAVFGSVNSTTMTANVGFSYSPIFGKVKRVRIIFTAVSSTARFYINLIGSVEYGADKYLVLDLANLTQGPQALDLTILTDANQLVIYKQLNQVSIQTLNL